MIDAVLQVDLLIGSAAKAEKELGWKPKILFQALVEEMVTADIKLVAEGDLVN